MSTFQEDLIKTERVMLMKKSNRGFFSNQRDVIIRVMIQGPSFKLIQDFIHVHLVYKFQEGLIKTE